MHVYVIYSLLPLVQMLVYVVVQLVEDFESESTTRDLAIGHSKVSGPTSLTSPPLSWTLRTRTLTHMHLLSI